MKTLYTYFLTLLVLLMAASCEQQTEKGPARFVNGVHDEILTAFPSLEARHEFDNNSKTKAADKYYLEQEYYRRGKESLFSGTLTNNHWNDSLKAEGVFREGKIQQFITWYANGAKKSEMNIKPDEEDSRYLTTTWYRSGEVQSRYDAREGKRYYKSGNLKSEWNETEATDYWENGNRQAYWPLEEGSGFKLHGTWIAWHKNGTPGIKGEYVNGKKDGKWVHQDSLGNVGKIILYDNGTVDSTIVQSSL